MIIKTHSPRRSLNQAFRKVTTSRQDIDLFKHNLEHMISNIDIEESEENVKNHLKDFLLNTYYKGKHLLNSKHKTDLVIYLENKQDSKAGVLFEVKRPSNKSEMMTKKNLNAKALHELILYYLQERIEQKNDEIKYLIATNIYEWFIFDATLFETLFYKNNHLIKDYNNWKADQKVSSRTDHFYNEIITPFLDKLNVDINFTHFNLADYQKLLNKNDKESEKKLIPLFKLLSPVHLLKQPFTNDSNSLDRNFYNELLHIIGLEEVKVKSKKIIRRKVTETRDSGSILENTIQILKTDNAITRITDPMKFGDDEEEQLYNIALELSLTWINRILFLKLLESQLHNYHKTDDYKFLNSKIIIDFDELYKLFHQVLAIKHSERTNEIKKKFNLIPYLNSSLFEITELENEAMRINGLDDNSTLQFINSTIFKDKTGKRIKGELPALHYLFKYLDAYNFTSEGKEEIEDDKKTLINASVLGLIFEKINGYKDGSYFTPGFITMYMSRELIRRAVVQKFNEKYNWECESSDDLYNHLADKKNSADILEANSVINSLKICDPAVGSGHFLVSVLNEIIAIKSELGILADEKGKILKDYEARVENDDLIVSFDDGEEIFEYRPPDGKPGNIQRVQETLFREKQTIIENCLFGVDINPNSVKIAQLRLWIELLKNAYYTEETEYAELETLPNIDINIKEGNSLISRFDVKQDIFTSADRKVLDIYKINVVLYKNEQDRNKRSELKESINKTRERFKGIASDPLYKERTQRDKLTDQLHNLNVDNPLFKNEDSFAKQAEVEKKRNNLTTKISKLSKKIEEKTIAYSKIYLNSFEWRFEFPEVLDENGNFIGFDVVIGNPPWGAKFKKEVLEVIKKSNEDIIVRMIDSYMFFVNRSFDIIIENGLLSMIVPDVLLYQIDNKKLREKILTNYSLDAVINLGDGVFEDVARPAAIFGLSSNGSHTTLVANYSHKKKKNISWIDFTEIDTNLYSIFPYKIFATNNFDGYKILSKIDGNTLSSFIDDDGIQRGVSPDLKEAFIVNKSVVKKFNLEKEKLKPTITGGVDLLKYRILIVDKLLIYTSAKDKLTSLPNIKNFINNFANEITCKEVIEEKHSLYCLHRARDEKIFDKSEKIIGVITGDQISVAIDDRRLYPTDGLFLFNCDKIENKFIVGLLNSKLLTYFYRLLSLEKGRTLAQIKPTILEDLPIVNSDKKIVKIITSKVDEIITMKKQNSTLDTTALETEIDQKVYKLYGLTKEEIKIVERVS